ncbi:MAG TPA: GNAT family N-acetyltransferase [Chitinophagaceae bacterium]|nr:GNAT family N-acetyltransferase [Chitinophagaceae bacterium]
MIRYLRTDSENKDFVELVKLLDADLKVRDGDDHAFYAQFNKTASIRNTIVAYDDEMPVACGAIKAFDQDSVEVKRMYVVESRRRMGLAKGVLTELEKWAFELGYKSLVLETGKNQPEAIRLYSNTGYHITENYGQYIGVDNSVCFMKVIK